jgi:hypothetical protein
MSPAEIIVTVITAAGGSAVIVATNSRVPGALERDVHAAEMAEGEGLHL